mgnify:CR=1 FL=1
MIFRGAEAVVGKIKWHDFTAVSKVRNKRSYRHPELERKLVVERLRSESRVIEYLLSKGVLVPSLYEVNAEKSQIIMEFIDGMTQVLEQATLETTWFPQQFSYHKFILLE